MAETAQEQRYSVLVRRNVLLRSVQRLLDDDEALIEAAFLWTRRPWSYLYGTVALVALVGVAIAAGFEPWPTRLAIGFAGAAIAVAATTDYRILALTTRGLVWCRAGRLRQVARSIIDRPDRSIAMEPVGSTMISADWRIGGIDYTVTRSAQQPIERIRAAKSQF